MVGYVAKPIDVMSNMTALAAEEDASLTSAPNSQDPL